MGAVECPVVSREDIINSCGVDEVHDGVSYTRTACVIAVARAKETFEPYVHQLGFRLAHIARRLLPVAMYLLQKEGRILTGHEAFLKRIGACFAKFVDQKVKACQEKCREDLQSTTHFVTWSLHSGNKAARLRAATRAGRAAKTRRRRSRRIRLGRVPRREPRAEGRRRPSRPSRSPPRRIAAATNDDEDVRRDEHRREAKRPESGALMAANDGVGGKDVMSLMDHTLENRQMKDVTLDVVDLLVRQIYAGIRGYVVQSVELKFNCFFLMPLMHEFAGFLRQEMEVAFEENLDAVFDVRMVRAALEERQRKLERTGTDGTHPGKIRNHP